MHEFMTRGGPVSLDHMRKLHDVADDLSAAPSEPVGALATSAASSHHAGTGEGRQRAPDAVRDAMRAGLRAHVVIDDATADALMVTARVYVHSLWDHAVALAAEEGPVPLVGAEAWVEGDEAYAKRIYVTSDRMPFERVRAAFRENTSGILNSMGRDVGLPRACLVPAEDAP